MTARALCGNKQRRRCLPPAAAGAVPPALSTARRQTYVTERCYLSVERCPEGDFLLASGRGEFRAGFICPHQGRERTRLERDRPDWFSPRPSESPHCFFVVYFGGKTARIRWALINRPWDGYDWSVGGVIRGLCKVPALCDVKSACGWLKWPYNQRGYQSETGIDTISKFMHNFMIAGEQKFTVCL